MANGDIARLDRDTWLGEIDRLAQRTSDPSESVEALLRTAFLLQGLAPSIMRHLLGEPVEPARYEALLEQSPVDAALELVRFPSSVGFLRPILALDVTRPPKSPETIQTAMRLLECWLAGAQSLNTR